MVYSLRDGEWDELLSRSIAAALVVCKGHTRLGEAIGELAPEEISRFLRQVGVEAEDEDVNEGEK